MEMERRVTAAGNVRFVGVGLCELEPTGDRSVGRAYFFASDHDGCRRFAVWGARRSGVSSAGAVAGLFERGCRAGLSW